MSDTVHGLIAEFDSCTLLLAAARRARSLGYRRMDGYAPFPVEGLPEALGRPKTKIPLIVLIGGIIGASAGYLLQWYASAVSYPLNIGGRPVNSWPMFIPITFELTILCAALSAFFGTLILNRLPQLYHPVFNSPGFERASIDRFFLCISADDAHFDPKETRDFLASLGSLAVEEVPE